MIQARKILILLFTFLSTYAADAAKNVTPPDVAARLDSYNVTFDTPSSTGSMESMPLGNGDLTANVWVERDGDLMLYIGKSDCWSEATRLLKVGRVRVSLSPNPFVNCPNFAETLDLRHGRINLTAGKTKITLRVDANYPSVIIDVKSPVATTLTATTEILRKQPFTLTNNDMPERGSFSGVCDGPFRPSETADVLASGGNDIIWYHRNTTSLFQRLLTAQGGKNLVGRHADPYINRTFGALMRGRGLVAVNDTTLASAKPQRHNSLTITALTSQTPEASQWVDEIRSLADASPSAADIRQHEAWWDRFWGRSWVFLTGDDDAIRATRAYILQRYMVACQSRGAYPVKFNGGSLTFDYDGLNGDNRRWGPGYWHQNCRLVYWPLVASGDYDLLRPWFAMYSSALPLQRELTREQFGHDGAYFPETMNFFGLFIGDDWGWRNSDGKASQTRWIRYHFQGALEVLANMIEYYRHTDDRAFAQEVMVPFATDVIRFFDRHWPRIQGRLRFAPANSLEQFWDCVNPVCYNAALRHDIPAMLALPSDLVGEPLRAEWTALLEALPPIPMSEDGSHILPAEEYGKERNFENPELYTVWPYRLFSKGRPGYETALNTYRDRRWKRSNCWSQCAAQAAVLGLGDEVREGIMNKVNSVVPEIRFPAFWKPGSDYTPDLDNGGLMAVAIQEMLLQESPDGGDPLLFPALPAGWAADFRLYTADRDVRAACTSDGHVTVSDIKDRVKTPVLGKL